MSDQSPPPPVPSQQAQQASPAASQPAYVSGERHVSSVAGKVGLTKKQGAFVVVGATALALAFVLLRPLDAPVDPNRTQDDQLRVQTSTRYEPPPIPPVTPASFPMSRPSFTPPTIPTQQALLPGLVQAPLDPMAKARRAPLLAFGSNGSSSAGASQGGPEGNGF